MQAFDGQVWTYCHLSVLDPNVVAGRDAHGRRAGRPRRRDRRRHRPASPPPAPARDRVAAAGGLVPVLRRQGLHLVGRRPERRSGPCARLRGAPTPAPARSTAAPSSRWFRRRRLRPPPWSYFSHAGGLGSVAVLPTRDGMAPRLRAHLPRVALLVLVGLAATATLTYAAGQPGSVDARVRDVTTAPQRRRSSSRTSATRPSSSPRGRSRTPASPGASLGSVHGYAANIVVAQSPAAGHPRARHRRAAHHPDLEAERSLPAGRAGRGRLAVRGHRRSSPPTSRPPSGLRIRRTTAKPAVTKPQRRSATTATPAGRDDDARSRATTPPKPRRDEDDLAAEPPGRVRRPRRAQGAARRDAAHRIARSCSRTWLDAHPTKTNANVAHWLYQNAWIVTGAKFGWWHGAEALTTLIAVDRRAQQLWGIGSKSAQQAQSALSEVQSRSK